MTHERLRVRILIPLWGATYYARWFQVPALALQSPRNLPYLQSRADVELVFLTKAQDITPLHANHVFVALARRVTVRTITIDEFFPDDGKVSYGVPLTLAYAKGIRDLGEDGLGTFVILLNADFVLSDGSLANLFARIEQGFDIVAAPSLRVVEHKARPVLAHHLSNRGLSGREMMQLTEDYLHQTVLSRIINDPQLIEAYYYHLVYWRVNRHCLAARYLLLMPFCFQLRRHMETITCPVDYGFLEELCPGGRYTAMTDSDDFLMLELQDRDSEAYLLEVARKFPDWEQARDHKISKMASNIAEWSTREHRRAATYTLFFHSRDLPADVGTLVSEFDTRMNTMLAALPAPIPVFRHFQWLGAVHHYRAGLTGTGLAPYPKALWDVGNDIYVDLLPMTRDEVSRAAPQWPPLPKGGKRTDIVNYLREASTVITLDGLVADLAALPKSTRVFSVPLAQAQDLDLGMHLLLPTATKFGEADTLGIYLLIDTFAHLSKFRNIYDAAINGGGRVILVFRTNDWSDAVFRENTWIFSLLQYVFPSDQYTAECELVPDSRTASRHAGRTESHMGFVVRLFPRNAARQSSMIGWR